MGHIRKAAACIIILFACAVMLCMDSLAASRIVIPNAYKYGKYSSSSKKLDLSAKTYVSHTWHGIDGQVHTSTNRSSKIANTYGCKLFTVPTVRSGFTYTDCLDIVFNNVGSAWDRKLNATLHVDEITFGPVQHNTTGGDSAFDSPQAGIFMLPTYGNMQLFFGRGDQEEWFPGLEQRYEAIKELTVTITVTYADTGEVVSFPFNHKVSDIDSNDRWCSYGATEGITFGSGYTGNIYVYENSRLTVTGTEVRVPNDGNDHNWPDFNMTPDATANSDGEVESNDPRVTEASEYMNACWASTAGGKFTATYHGGNYSMFATYYSSFLGYEEPVKTSSPDSSSNLENMHWDIRYDLPSYYVDVFDPYSSFVFTDVIPAGQTYKGWALYLDDQVITPNATGSYDSGSRTLTVSIKPDYLKQISIYGKQLRLRVSCTWQNGTARATNTPQVHIDGVTCTGKPATAVNPDTVAVGLHKHVLNKKETYGVGDIVDYYIDIDFSDYEVIDFDYPLASDSGTSIRSYSHIGNFTFTDTIPAGLEIVGTPRIVDMGNSSVSVGSTTLKKRTGPMLSDELKAYAFSRKSFRGYTIPAQTVTMSSGGTYDQPEVVVPPLAVKDDAGIFSNTVAVGEYMASGAGGNALPTFQEFFSTSVNQAWGGTYPAANAFNMEMLGTNNKYTVSITPNKISVTSTANTLSDWSSSPLYWDAFDLCHLCIWYQCKVTSAGLGKELVNTTDVSAQNVGVRVDKRNETTKAYARVTIMDRFPMSATASASIRVAGYSITTEVVNGTIDPDVVNIAAGSDVSISYRPNYGYYLKELYVDGASVDPKTFPNMYDFRNINASHHIKAVYAPAHKVETSIVHGAITPTKAGIIPGDSWTVSYSPEEGYMVESVTVDGVAQDVSKFPSSYPFVNIRADHKVHVVCVPLYTITTSIEHGTIDDDIKDIPPGSERTVRYSPDEGYYVKSVTVDGVALDKNSLKSHLDSYRFTNIQDDHDIKVVCAKQPVLVVRKEAPEADSLAYGDKPFLFVVSGTDYLGNARMYRRQVVLEAGNRSGYVELHIPAGEWTVSEEVTGIWEVESVRAGESCTVSGSTAVLDTRDSDRGSVTFVNHVAAWDKPVDAPEVVVNEFL